MARKRFDDSTCSVARALDQVGDWWSLLIVLHAMHGTQRFVDFQQELGIAKNILCDRLARLVDNGVLKKVEAGEHGSRFEYRLTEKGRDLFAVVIALRQWGDKWNPAPGDAALAICERTTGEPIQTVQVHNARGEPVGVSDVVIIAEPQPEADPGTIT